MFFCAYFWYTVVLLTYSTWCTGIIHPMTLPYCPMCCYPPCLLPYVSYRCCSKALSQPPWQNLPYPIAMSCPSLQFLCIMKDIWKTPTGLPWVGPLIAFPWSVENACCYPGHSAPSAQTLTAPDSQGALGADLSKLIQSHGSFLWGTMEATHKHPNYMKHGEAHIQNQNPANYSRYIWCLSSFDNNVWRPSSSGMVIHLLLDFLFSCKELLQATLFLIQPFKTYILVLNTF